MNIQSIVITNCIGIFITLLVLYSSYIARRSRDLDSRLLTCMLLILFSACLMEMISFLVDGHPSAAARIMAWVSNTWIYLANPTFATFWVLYVDYHLHKKEKRLRTVYRPHLILLAVCWVAVLGNLFGHYLFTIDAQNVYARQPASYALFVLPVLQVIHSVVEVSRYRRCHRVVIIFPIWTFLLPFFIGIVAQALVYGVSLAWCATSLGLAALYMSMQNELAYRDALTGIYNRHYLNFALQTWSGHSGIMIDLDDFKDINDRFGHSQGDEALRDTAGILREIGPDNSIAIRFAGDEFILLLTTNREEQIVKTEQQIREAAEEFNRTSGRPYRISLSMGHAVYNQSSTDRFLEAIDHAMYQNKQQRHASGELAERRRFGR